MLTFSYIRDRIRGPRGTACKPVVDITQTRTHSTTALDPAHAIPGDEKNCGDWANGNVIVDCVYLVRQHRPLIHPAKSGRAMASYW